MSCNNDLIRIESAHSNFVLTREQYDSLVAYTRTPSFAARRDRVSEWFHFDQSQDLMLRITKVGTCTIVGCATFGAIVGAAAGNPLVGLAAGAGTGALITLIWGGIELRHHYNCWVKAYECKAILDEFKKLHKTKLELAEFICPVSQEIYIDPVLTPCLHTYERSTLLRWLKERSPTCPCCRAIVTPESLTVDYVMLGKMKQAYMQLARNEAMCDIYEPHIREAFVALSKDLDIQATAILKQASTELTLAHNKDKISSVMYLKKMSELIALFPEAAQSHSEQRYKQIEQT